MPLCAEDRTPGRQRLAAPAIGERAARLMLMLVLGAIGSIPLVLLTPPFQAPDEVQHFYRAFQLSELHLRSQVRNGVAGGMLPDSLPRLVSASVYTPDGIIYPALPAPMTKTLKLAALPLNPDAERFVAFPGSAFYSPLGYVPQALGIAVGRAAGAGPLALLYLGRLFNCVAALALAGLAVNAMPVAGELILLIALLPMSLFLDASLSPDAVVIGCALLFSALSFAASSRGRWRPRELAIAAAAAAVFCSVKPVYAPLLLASLVPQLCRHGNAARVFRSHAILVTAALGVSAGWLLLAKSTMTSPLSGAHPSTQLSFILHRPASLLHALVQAVSIHSDRAIYVQTVGVFGWLTVPLRPEIVYLLPLLSFVAVWFLCLRGSVEHSVRDGLWRLGLAFSSAVLILIAMYLMWAHVGQANITGVQGRYFIPLLPLAGLAAIGLAPGKRLAVPGWSALASIAGIVLVEIAASDLTIIRAFHLF